MPNPFPLDIVDKVNSPELLSYFQQFGEDGYVSAEDANKYKQALNYLYANIVMASMRRPTRFISPPTADMIEGDENNSVIISGDSDAVITVPAGIYPEDTELEITSLNDGVVHVTFPGGATANYSDIPFGATLVMKQVALNSWVCNFRVIGINSLVPVNRPVKFVLLTDDYVITAEDANKFLVLATNIDNSNFTATIPDGLFAVGSGVVLQVLFYAYGVNRSNLNYEISGESIGIGIHNSYTYSVATLKMLSTETHLEPNSWSITYASAIPPQYYSVNPAHNFVNDAAAAAGGIWINQYYHTDGVVKMRLT